MNSHSRVTSGAAVSLPTGSRERSISGAGQDLVRALFPYEDPIDKQLKINAVLSALSEDEQLGNFLVITR